MSLNKITEANQTLINSKQRLRQFVHDGELKTLIKQSGDCGAAEKLSVVLHEIGIKCIASDFDLTMTTRHSGGAVDISSTDGKDILRSLSQSFKHFANCCNNNDIRLCVVTFSDPTTAMNSRKRSSNALLLSGESLVHEVIKQSRGSFIIDKVYGYFPPLYAVERAYSPLGLTEPMPESKSFHLQQLCKDFNYKPHEVILIDDDINNCRVANREGYVSMTLRTRSGFRCNDLHVLI